MESVLSLAVVAATLYSILRIFLDAIATGQRDQAGLQAEVLALRRQVQVLERQIKRVKWTPADRMVLAALRDRLPRTAWAALRVQPETVLGWHRDLVRRSDSDTSHGTPGERARGATGRQLPAGVLGLDADRL
ncbi:MAG TPA: hypothetical protein VGS16_01605 [Candidatus Dormibacteraeota bacterium]|nr:hypothetical protein [Candidatus Dormibacteraeota bacterium]